MVAKKIPLLSASINGWKIQEQLLNQVEIFHDDFSKEELKLTKIFYFASK